MPEISTPAFLAGSRSMAEIRSRTSAWRSGSVGDSILDKTRPLSSTIPTAIFVPPISTAPMVIGPVAWFSPRANHAAADLPIRILYQSQTCRVRTSELKPQPELEKARCFPWRVTGNCPEKRIAHGRIRLPKTRVVGQVEDLGPHFQAHAFFGHERLVKVYIRVVDAVDTEVRKI